MKCQGIFKEYHHVTIQVDNELDNNENTDNTKIYVDIMDKLDDLGQNLFHIEKCKNTKGVNRNTYTYVIFLYEKINKLEAPLQLTQKELIAHKMCVYSPIKIDINV